MRKILKPQIIKNLKIILFTFIISNKLLINASDLYKNSNTNRNTNFNPNKNLENLFPQFQKFIEINNIKYSSIQEFQKRFSIFSKKI